MNDLISRQDAIDALKKKRIETMEKGQDVNLIWECLDAVAQLPSAQQWIPCSERLPEENGRYLVTRGLNACGSLWNRVYIVNYSNLMGLKKEKIWWDGNVGKSDFQTYEDVLAWQPLPEPYEPQESEG